MRPIAVIILFLFIAFKVKAQVVYPKDITVALDGSGDYKTIQEAVNSVRDFGQPVTIHIKNGVYHEKLIIPAWKTQVTLLGESKENTIITNSDHSGLVNPGGKDMYGNTKINTFTSFTVLVQGDDFTAKNLTIANASGRNGQALALYVEADRCIVENCNILGNQDTLYVSNENSRQYYKDCYIEGTTDFIFGEATCVFQSCTIKNLTNSFTTAASTTQRQKFGYVFLNCKLIAADTSVKKAYLGRPWRSFAKTVYIHCEIGGHIVPEGWNPWKGDPIFTDKDKTAYYAEYQNTGPGADTKKRVAWSHQLTAAEAKQYTIKNILGGKDDWDPETKR